MNRIIIITGGLVGILVFGTLGYMFLEGAPFLDSLYMTVITISTVGFGEKMVLHTASKFFTILLIFIGCGLVIILFSSITESMVEIGLQRFTGRKKMEAMIQELANHYIVCGYGRIGREICRTLTENNIPFVVIENSDSDILTAEEDGYLVLKGNATEDENLIKAGIEKARGLVSVVSSDADNVYIVLSARGQNPGLFIMARSSGIAGVEKKLLRAGASKVISPYSIGARRMAQVIVRPTVIDFIDLTMHSGDMGLRLEEIRVRPQSDIAGKSLLETRLRHDHNIIVVGIKRASGEMSFNPTPVTMIEAGDILVILGEREQIQALEQRLA